jgi:hypothetical protein
MALIGKKPGPDWTVIYDDTSTVVIEALPMTMFGVTSLPTAFESAADILALDCFNDDEFPNDILALYRDEIGSTIAAHLEKKAKVDGFYIWYQNLVTGDIEHHYVIRATGIRDAYAQMKLRIIPEGGNVDDYIELMGVTAGILAASDII